VSRDRYEELERAAILEDEQEQARPADGEYHKRPNAERMRRLPESFVRVPVSWFTTDPRPYPFEGPRGRLFLLILHLSRWGTRPVVLTDTITRQVYVSRQNKWKLLRRLEKDRWIVVERDGNKAAIVRPIVIAG
jgi:hypothetical protein